MFIISIKALIVILIILLIVSFFTLWERKVLGSVQRRQGPVFTGSFGLLQAITDGLKLIGKEVNVTQNSYHYIFFLSSIFSVSLSFLSWAVIPFNSLFIYSDINYGIFFLLAISSLNVYTILFSGWSSNSKYGILGSLRAAAQIISYEIPLFLSILPVLLISKTFNLLNIALFQIENSFFFLFFLFPFAAVFFVMSLAETNRTPFDLAEAESELVSGYNIEYSSITFAMFFLSEYNHILVMSAVFSILFLGGWANPFSSFMNTWDIRFDWIFGVYYYIVPLRSYNMIDVHMVLSEFLSHLGYSGYDFFEIIYDFSKPTEAISDYSLFHVVFEKLLPEDHSLETYFNNLIVWKSIKWEDIADIWIENIFFFVYKAELFTKVIVSVFETSVLLFKTIVISTFFILIRAVLPRYKFVNFIKICWQGFIPLLLFLNIFVIFLIV